MVGWINVRSWFLTHAVAENVSLGGHFEALDEGVAN